MLSIDGFECAGHPGEDDVTALILLVIMVAYKIGYCCEKVKHSIHCFRRDWRRKRSSCSFIIGVFIFLLKFSAEGVNMGTRFMCTVESPIHQAIKEKIVAASERDTVLMFRTLHNTARVFKNAVSREVVDIEKKKPNLQFEDIRHLVSGQRGREVYTRGDSDYGIWTAGQVVGIIDDIPTCEELLDRMVKEAESIITTRLLPMISKAKL